MSIITNMNSERISWITNKSMVILESEDSEEDHIDKHGYELCDAIGYDSTSKVEYDRHSFFI